MGFDELVDALTRDQRSSDHSFKDEGMPLTEYLYHQNIPVNLAEKIVFRYLSGKTILASSSSVV
jgi:hypothetical protein